MNLLRVLCCGLCLFVGTMVYAQDQTFGNYTVHYIAVNSTFIEPDTAAQYNIVRSARRAFLNIAIIRNNADGTTTPVTAKVSGGKINLMQQQGVIDFNEIREGTAIYYIGQFDFSNAELVRFKVAVQPEQQGPTHTIEWETRLYSD